MIDVKEAEQVLQRIKNYSYYRVQFIIDPKNIQILFTFNAKL